MDFLIEIIHSDDNVDDGPEDHEKENRKRTETERKKTYKNTLMLLKGTGERERVMRCSISVSLFIFLITRACQIFVYLHLIRKLIEFFNLKVKTKTDVAMKITEVYLSYLLFWLIIQFVKV